jgi:hypothetical protein
MSHRPKHRRINWATDRLEQALERANAEAARPAPKPKKRPARRTLPSVFFLGRNR